LGNIGAASFLETRICALGNNLALVVWVLGFKA
jgi:hypothetical protein